MSEKRKDPSAVLDYTWDWNSTTAPGGPWLAAGETISSHTVTVPAGITKTDETITGGKITAWIAGGTVGNIYPMVCRIVTSAGRTDERTIRLRIVER